MNTDVLIIGGGCGRLDTAIQLRQQTVVVKNRRVLARGRWRLLLRAFVDRRYLKLRT